jgi:hypothetical protein
MKLRNNYKMTAAMAAVAITAAAPAFAAVTLIGFEDWEAATHETGFGNTDYTGSHVYKETYIGIPGTHTSINQPRTGSRNNGIIENSNNSRHLTLTNGMGLATGGYDSVRINFDFEFYQNHADLYLYYSAAGDFSDTQTVKFFASNNVVYTHGVDYNETIELDSSSYSFTDAAKIRWGANSGGYGNQYTYLDNIRIEGVAEAAAVPEPSTTALLGLGGLALILRRRK